LKKTMQDAEKRVEVLSAELARLDAALADSALYADTQRAQKITLERGLIAKRLAEAEDAWLTATAVYEDAERAAEEASA